LGEPLDIAHGSPLIIRRIAEYASPATTYMSSFRLYRIVLLAVWLASALRPVGAAAEPKTIVFFGDSLTYGLGLEDPGAEAYPALIAQKIAAAQLPWRVVNAGLSGDTTAGGLRRINWVLQRPIDCFVLALGANDGLRGIAPNLTHENLRGIIAQVRAKDPSALIVLAGMRLPEIMGADYARDFAAVFPAVAKEEHVPLIPFLLEGVGGRPELNGPDSIHPNAAGHRIVAETVWRTLQPLLAAGPGG
jgi:acyl-CoA thioesterase I